MVVFLCCVYMCTALSSDEHYSAELSMQSWYGYGGEAGCQLSQAWPNHLRCHPNLFHGPLRELDWPYSTLLPTSMLAATIQVYHR